MTRPNAALKFVVLLGFVSLFADVTYEGARSIAGPFLGVLGASGTVVGIVAGAGELVGYGIRLFSGYVTDRLGRYWGVALAGYALNLLAVPFLALAGGWPVAAALLVAERVGKGIRAPARDAMLSHATQQMGRGWGFGLHEAMDQVGATAGPLVVAGMWALEGNYRAGFAVLAIPALLALSVLLLARRLYPNPRHLEVPQAHLEAQGLPPSFWVYMVAVGCMAAGFADFPLIAYHLGRRGAVPPGIIPLYYALAMAVDALAALFFGRLFDRMGTWSLVLTTGVAAFFAPLVFFGGAAWAAAGMVLWGIGMGAQESIVRAEVAETVPMSRRASAYGLFNAGYGMAWFAGSALMGVLYDRSLPALVAFSVGAQLLAVPVLLRSRSRGRTASR